MAYQIISALRLNVVTNSQEKDFAISMEYLSDKGKDYSVGPKLLKDADQIYGEEKVRTFPTADEADKYAHEMANLLFSLGLIQHCTIGKAVEKYSTDLDGFYSQS